MPSVAPAKASATADSVQELTVAEAVVVSANTVVITPLAKFQLLS